MMGFLAHIFSRIGDLETEPLPAGTSLKDARAVDRYERMLRTSPPHSIERTHVEAFEKLTPEQLDLLFDRFTEQATRIEDRPLDPDPASLARSASAVESRRPDTLPDVLRTAHSGPRTGGGNTASLLAWYAVASAAWSPFVFPW